MSSAMHRAPVGSHEILASAVVPSILNGADQLAATVGVVENNASPLLSTATHKVVEIQSIPCKRPTPVIFMDTHDGRETDGLPQNA